MNEEQFTHYIAEYWSAKEPDTLGLAWAENAITSMQGRLFVEPSQSLDGIAINLVLLRAKPKQH